MTYKTRMPVKNYWANIVDYYYAHPDIQDSGHTIWDWLKCEYGARRIYRPETHNSLLEFEKDEDVTTFVLRWS